MFHHSLEAVDTHPNKINLSMEERKKYCDDQFFRTWQILVIADNEAYILFDTTHVQRCRKEILKRHESASGSGVRRETAADSGD